MNKVAFNTLSSAKFSFLGVPWDFSTDVIIENIKNLCSQIKLRSLVMVNQVHGSNVVTVKEPIVDLNDGLNLIGDADAILADQRLNISLAVKTADCVPLIVACDKWYGVIHAGWRGIAQGIIENTFNTLFSLTSSNLIHVAIGPCISLTNYQVGFEVIQSIGEDAQFKLINSNIHLDLINTIKIKLQKLSSENNRNIESKISSICTFADLNFHSFRRNGAKSGRNLGIVCKM
jgi:polyphenol oxidase